jgi:hypothetical protein
VSSGAPAAEEEGEKQMKYRAMMLAAAGVFGSVSIAGAQEARPAPEPSPAPASAPAADAPAPPAAPAEASAPTAPADPGAQPAPAPQPPPPAPASEAPPPPQQPSSAPPIVFGVELPNEGADKTDPLDEEGPPLRWRGTTFTWNQSATTTMLGVGRDIIGTEDESYGWAFNFRPRFFILDEPLDKVVASADFGWETEFTNGATTDRNQTILQDLSLGLAYSRKLLESGGKDKGEYTTTAGLSGRLRFPVSRFSSESSINAGKYLTTYLGPRITQTIKVLGKKADGLNTLTLDGDVSWRHLFAESYTPVDEGLQYERQNATGQTVISDQVSGTSFAQNTLSMSIQAGLPLYKELRLSTTFAYVARFKHDFQNGGGGEGACDVVIANEGCVEAQRDPTRTLYQPATLFGVGLGYGVLDVVDVEIGYMNVARAIGEDGQRRNVFYSPGAQFYLDLTANLDVIYTKVAKPSKKRPAAQQTASR